MGLGSSLTPASWPLTCMAYILVGGWKESTRTCIFRGRCSDKAHRGSGSPGSAWSRLGDDRCGKWAEFRVRAEVSLAREKKRALQEAGSTA